MRYNPGDKIICIRTMSHVRAGDRGTVVGAMDNYSCVRFERDNKSNYWVDNDCIVPDAAYTPECPTRHVVFDINDNGGTAKYIDGKKTVRAAEIHRAGSDEPNDFAAMIWLLSKLFPCELHVEHLPGGGAENDADSAAERACGEDAASAYDAPGFITVTDDEGSQNIICISQIIRIIPACGADGYSSIVEIMDCAPVCCEETAAEIMEMIRKDCGV